MLIRLKKKKNVNRGKHELPFEPNGLARSTLEIERGCRLQMDQLFVVRADKLRHPNKPRQHTRVDQPATQRSLLPLHARQIAHHPLLLRRLASHPDIHILSRVSAHVHLFRQSLHPSDHVLFQLGLQHDARSHRDQHIDASSGRSAQSRVVQSANLAQCGHGLHCPICFGLLYRKTVLLSSRLHCRARHFLFGQLEFRLLDIQSGLFGGQRDGARVANCCRAHRHKCDQSSQV